MAYLIVGLLLVASFVAVLALGPRAAAAGSPPDASVAAKAKGPTRAELEQRLKALAASPGPPRELKSAMCYEPSARYTRAEYVCPKDGERTVYALDGKPPASSQVLTFLNEQLPSMRETVEGLRRRGLDASLDESQLCRKCHPESGRGLELALVLRLPDEEQARRIEGIAPLDLQLIAEFLSGETHHALGGPDREALAEHQARIAELLGLGGARDAGIPKR